jgi:hypothetical protein
MSQFLGKADPLSSSGIGLATSELGITTAQLWAVIQVETGGCGFFPDRRPEILFEHRIFQNLTRGTFDRDAPDLSNSGHEYGAAGAHQYDRLERAMALPGSDAADAALKSTSWGLGQVLGSNATSVGYRDVHEMVNAMTASEDDQLKAMVNFITHNKLQHALAGDDFPTFARGYNGPNFAQNHYDKQLAAANAKFVHGGLPDLTVRTGQVLLRFLKHDPGRIDGIMGSRTRSALVAALGPSILTRGEMTITEDTVAQLKESLLRMPVTV